MRASWKGYLKIDLVAFQVQAFNAMRSDQGEIHFHQLHAECHSRIHYAKVCPKHGEVSSKDIVLGYEYGKDKYVEVTPEELDKLRPAHERALVIDTFIGPQDLDPINIDGRCYYLTPVGEQSSEPYALLHDVMSRRKRYGIGQVVFSGRDQLVMLRTDDGLLTMVMLNYHDQVRPASEIKVKKARVSPKKLELAEKLIEAATEDEFDITAYKDPYEKRLAELIGARIKGKEVVAPEEEEEPEVINLMEALSRSVEQSAHKSGKQAKGKRKKAAAKRKKQPAKRRRAS